MAAPPPAAARSPPRLLQRRPPQGCLRPPGAGLGRTPMWDPVQGPGTERKRSAQPAPAALPEGPGAWGQVRAQDWPPAHAPPPSATWSGPGGHPLRTPSLARWPSCRPRPSAAPGTARPGNPRPVCGGPAWQRHTCRPRGAHRSGGRSARIELQTQTLSPGPLRPAPPPCAGPRLQPRASQVPGEVVPAGTAAPWGRVVRSSVRALVSGTSSPLPKVPGSRPPRLRSRPSAQLAPPQGLRPRLRLPAAHPRFSLPAPRAGSAEGGAAGAT